MKCLWFAALALVMGFTMTNTASAQNDWGSPSQIGSYQSILSSYAQQSQDRSPPVQRVAAVQGSGTRVAPSFSAPAQGSGTRVAPSFNAPIQGSGTTPSFSAPAFQQPIQGAPIQGAPIQGAPIQGAPIQGVPVQGAPIQGVPVQGAPVQSFPAIQSAPSVGAYQPAVAYDTGIPCSTGTCGSGASYAPAYSAPSFSSPVYSAPSFAAPTAAIVSAAPRRNRVIGARGLIFTRNYENSRQYSFNNAGDSIYSNDADHNTLGGFEGFITSRGSKGSGWEARYLGVFPGTATAEIQGSPIYATTTLSGLQNVFHADAPPGVGASAFEVFNFGERHTITRNTDIDSVEINFLRNGGCYTNRHGSSSRFEVLGGFRWFQFDEDLRYDSFTSLAGYPSQYSYNIGTQNTLLGVQIGARSETCLTKRLSFATGTKFGLFNNRSRVRQSIFDNTGVFSTLNAGPDIGRDYNFNDQDNSFAVLGELDLGLIYQISCRLRLNFGYRAIGVSGVALAGDQVPFNFASVREISEVDNSGSLILHGGYAGFEMSF